jgi:hypothetical protein
VEVNGGELESISTVFKPEACELIRARAVTDALLAKGKVRYVDLGAGMTLVIAIPTPELDGAE